MAALKLPAMLCMIYSCMGVNFPQRYERLYPIITQSLPQTLYQFLHQPQAQEFLPQLTSTPDASASRGTQVPTTTTTTTTTTTRRESKTLPTKPQLESITQASLHPIAFRGSAASSSYSSIGNQEPSVPSTASPVLTTPRPNDIPVRSEKDSLKPSEVQRANQPRGNQSIGVQSIGDTGTLFRSEVIPKPQKSVPGNKATSSPSAVQQQVLFRTANDHTASFHLPGNHEQSFSIANHDDQSASLHLPGNHEQLFSIANHNGQGASIHLPGNHEQLFSIANHNDQSASIHLPGNHEHSFSIINHGESLAPHDENDVLLQSTDNNKEAFKFTDKQQRLLGSASKQRASRLTSAPHSQTNAKNKKVSGSGAGKKDVKIHHKRDFGATPKVFYEHPHQQTVFEAPHAGVFHHQVAGSLLHGGEGLLGDSHHDLSLSTTSHLHGASLHVGKDYHRPAKYDFRYVVKDGYGGNDFGHQESRSGHDTKGAYYVQLPDGRRQTVSYFVNKGSGFVAKVHYEGKAVHPQPKHGLHGYQSGAVSHAPVHQLETFDHVPKGHNLHNTFAHGGAAETIFSLPTSSKFH